MKKWGTDFWAFICLLWAIAYMIGPPLLAWPYQAFRDFRKSLRDSPRRFKANFFLLLLLGVSTLTGFLLAMLAGQVPYRSIILWSFAATYFFGLKAYNTQSKRFDIYKEARLKEAFGKWQDVTAPVTEATRKAARLTEKDARVYINTKIN